MKISTEASTSWPRKPPEAPAIFNSFVGKPKNSGNPHLRSLAGPRVLYKMHCDSSPLKALWHARSSSGLCRWPPSSIIRGSLQSWKRFGVLTWLPLWCWANLVRGKALWAGASSWHNVASTRSVSTMMASHPSDALRKLISCEGSLGQSSWVTSWMILARKHWAWRLSSPC